MKKARSKTLTDRQAAKVESLAALPDDKIDTSDIPEIRDWSGARRGLLYRPLETHTTPLTFDERPVGEMRDRAARFHDLMRRRRTVRDFSDRPVPAEVIEHALLTAGSAPSGAHRQPWHFVVVTDAGKKAEIREAAEREEREFYGRRASKEWLEALAPLGTDANKPFLTTAPVLIAVFLKRFTLVDGDEGTAPTRLKNYYTTESVGIATGFLIAALHNAGLATLTHTPSPMRFLNALLDRPRHERPYLLLVAGYPAPDARVPVLARYALDELATFV